jgi:hypothetical protein
MDIKRCPRDIEKGEMQIIKSMYIVWKNSHQNLDNGCLEVGRVLEW